jgi:hypothetical protein
LGAVPGVMKASVASIRPAEFAAGSRGAIGKGRIAAFAVIRIGWNADGSIALGGFGVREPAIPGAATRASAAVSAAPATSRVGRTMLGTIRRIDSSCRPTWLSRE